MNNSKYRRILENIAGLSVVAMFFIFDRMAKHLALGQMSGLEQPIIGNWLTFHYAANTGIAFSLPLQGNLLKFGLSMIVIALFLLIFYLILFKKSQTTIWLPLTFILIGAISNLQDRYLYGAVIDYFDLRFFTIFNIADIMITGGVISSFFYNWKTTTTNN